MKNTQLLTLLKEIREVRDQTLVELIDLTEDDFNTPTDSQRWDDIRRVLLRFGDHMREHANQIEGTRVQNNQPPTMPQRMLAEAEISWGKLLASVIGLTDEDIAVTPPDGGWSAVQVLEHLKTIENQYLDLIRSARSVPFRDE